MSATIKHLTVNARYDLQAPSVTVYYETSSSIDGQDSLSLVPDFYPNPQPTDPLDEFRGLQFTVDLRGIQTRATDPETLVCDAINPNDPKWWIARHPQLQPHDITNPGDEANEIASFTIISGSVYRDPNPFLDAQGNETVDKNYSNELTSGELKPWMPFQGQRITLEMSAVVVRRNGTSETTKFTYQCNSTNAVSGTYSSQTVTNFAEPVPVGLARQLYDAISVLQFEGSVTLQEEEVSGAVRIGQLVNFTGGALAEWTTMAALVQGVTENIDTGETTIQFGPPRHLSAGELVDLLRINRQRLLQNSFAMRISGNPS